MVKLLNNISVKDNFWTGTSKKIQRKIIKIDGTIIIEEITSNKKFPYLKTKYPNEVRQFYPYEFESDDFYC